VAVSEAAATANNAIATNRICVVRNMSFPLPVLTPLSSVPVFALGGNASFRLTNYEGITEGSAYSLRTSVEQQLYG
jgi:hypothetical protein